jgi:hypothetical protein
MFHVEHSLDFLLESALKNDVGCTWKIKISTSIVREPLHFPRVSRVPHVLHSLPEFFTTLPGLLSTSCAANLFLAR